MIRRHETSTIDRKQAKAQLAMLLASARSLDHFTVDFLTRSYKVSAKDAEYALTIAKQKRAAHG